MLIMHFVWKVLVTDQYVMHTKGTRITIYGNVHETL